MKSTLLIATLSMVLASPSAFAKSELETLRSLCQEQKRQINELEEANERLRSDRSESHATPPRTETVSSAIAKPAAVGKGHLTPTTSPSTYTVKAGDNFEKIARKVGTNPENLAKSNGMKTISIIHPGQKLKVPGITAASDAPAVAATTAPSPRISGKSHKVETGETLFSISKKHGMSTEALVAANPRVKPSSLRPGQFVSLGGDAPATTLINAAARAKTPPTVERASHPSPATKSAPTRETTPASSDAQTTTETQPAAATALAPAAEKAALSPTPEKKIRPVSIEAEMTYGEFATQHGTNAERLNALNGLDLTTATILAKGSELYVPAQP